MKYLLIMILTLTNAMHAAGFSLEIGNGYSSYWIKNYDTSILIDRWYKAEYHSSATFITPAIHTSLAYGSVFFRGGYQFEYVPEVNDMYFLNSDHDKKLTARLHHLQAAIGFSPGFLKSFKIGLMYGYRFKTTLNLTEVIKSMGAKDLSDPMYEQYIRGTVVDNTYWIDSINGEYRYISRNLNGLDPPRLPQYSPHSYGIYLAYWRIYAQAMFGEHYFSAQMGARIFDF